MKKKGFWHLMKLIWKDNVNTRFEPKPGFENLVFYCKQRDQSFTLKVLHVCYDASRITVLQGELTSVLLEW